MPKNNVLPKGAFFTTIPDHFLSHIMTELSASELRVMLYIYLHTLGYGKLTDAISYDQFLHGITTRDGRQLDKGAGVSRRSLITALAGLEKHGLISREKEGYKAATIHLETETLQAAEPNLQETESAFKSSEDEVEVQILPKIQNQQVQILLPTCRDLHEHEENKNRVQSSTSATIVTEQFTTLVEKAEKQAIELITEKINSVQQAEASRLVKIAFNKHGRDLPYIERLVSYVTSNSKLENPAAVLTSLIKSDAERSLPDSTTKRRSKPAKTFSQQLSSIETDFAKLLIQKGLVGTPAKANYLAQLAYKNKIGSSSFSNLVNLATGAPAGQRSATFEFLFNQAIERATRASKPMVSSSPTVDLGKFTLGGKYAQVGQSV